MNRKLLSVLLVLVLAVGGTGVALFFKDRAAWNETASKIGQKFLATLPINDIAQIYIKHGKAEVTLSKTEAGWTLKERGGFPADYSQVADFLLKVRDLKVTQTEAIGEAQRPRLDLADPAGEKNAGTLVEFRDKAGKAAQTLILGRKHFGPPPVPVPGQQGPADGRYLLASPAATSYVLTSDPLNQAEPAPEKWIAKDFVRIDRVRELGVAPAGSAAWKIARTEEAGDWVLVGAKAGEKLDPSKAVGTVNPLYSPSFTDIAATAKPEEVGLDKPTVISIDTFDGFRYEIKLGQKAGDAANYYLTYTVDANIVKEPRKPGKDEKAEDKDKLDKEHEKKAKDLEDRFKREKSLEKWIYVVEKKPFAALVRERAQMLEDNRKDAAPRKK